MHEHSLFDCVFNDNKLSNFSSFEILIEADASKIKNCVFDFSIVNQTSHDTNDFHKQYAFEFEDQQWKLVYFGCQLEEIMDSLFRPEIRVNYSSLEKQILEFIEVDT